MKLKSLRIENFKCIEDTEEFHINHLTCLVGKNEAGKTAILQALNKLKPVDKREAEFIFDEYPRMRASEYKEHHEDKPDNVITSIWELEEQDREAFLELLGPESEKVSTLVIKKGYDNKFIIETSYDKEKIVSHYTNNSELSTEEKKELDGVHTIDELITKLEEMEEPSVDQMSFLDLLNVRFEEKNIQEAITSFLYDKLPTFVYFPDYRKMPGQISLNDLVNKINEERESQEEKVFLALLDLSGTSVDEIQAIDKFESLITELEAVSNRISNEIFNYWSQNKHLEVQFRFDNARSGDPPPFNSGYIFRTRVRNNRHGVTIGFDERSAGFVWFFSFLVWFSQVRNVYGEDLIILLDEPGLSLHGKAQQDLLRFIKEKLVSNYQVIYTAHSPFMVDYEDFSSVRTVEDLEAPDGTILGTKVGEKIFSVDRDTVLPLQSAMGYEITQSLFIGKHSLVVEGPSEINYLNWFSKQLMNLNRTYLDKRWVITPVGGIDKVPSFVALFGGNKLHVAVLTDYHKGIKRKVKTLQDSDLIEDNHVVRLDQFVDQDEADIEDLLGRTLYLDIVSRCYSLTDSTNLPETKSAKIPLRVVKEVEDHFRTLPPDISEFDHFTPSEFLAYKAESLEGELHGLNEALDRFEKLFKQLNALLPDQKKDEKSQE